MSTRGRASSAAHSVLQYVITRALLEGKTCSTRVKVPMTDIVDEYEDIQVAPEGEDVVLVVDIATSWDTGVEDLEVEMEEEEDDGIEN